MFYLFLLSYLASDFVFANCLAGEKPFKWLNVCLYRLILSAAFNAAAAVIYILASGMDLKVLLIFVLVTAAHYALSILKTFLVKTFFSGGEESYVNKTELLIFTAELFINIAVIAVLCLVLSADAFNLNSAFIFQICVILTGLIFATTLSSVFIRKIFKLFSIKPPEKPEENVKDYGMVTGIIERAATFIALYFGIVQIAAAVYAFKAIIRFDEYKKGSQYYILGNLLSIFFMVASYGVYRLLLLL